MLLGDPAGASAPAKGTWPLPRLDLPLALPLPLAPPGGDAPALDDPPLLGRGLATFAAPSAVGGAAVICGERCGECGGVG
jgi:hypothetical protein